MNAAALKFEPTEDAITLHGLGFLQVKLGGNQRLHVWHPDLPRRRCFEHSSIHDHRFGFVSRVLVGEQVSRVFDHHTPDADEGCATHVAYLHEGPRTRFGNRPWLADGELIVSHHYTERVGVGCEYTMQPYVYHSTHPGGDGRVATLMTKVSDGDRGAHSLCAVGVDPDVDFDRKQWSDDDLWRVVADVLSKGSAG